MHLSTTTECHICKNNFYIRIKMPLKNNKYYFLDQSIYIRRTLSMVLVLCELWSFVSMRVIFLIRRWLHLKFVANNDWNRPPSLLHYKKILSFHSTSSYLCNNITITREKRTWCHTLIIDTTYVQTFLWISSLIDWTRCYCEYCHHSSTSNWKVISLWCKIHCSRLFGEKACLYDYYAI